MTSNPASAPIRKGSLISVGKLHYRLWVSDDRRMLVRLWDDGRVEVATRANTWETWGPPTYLNEERV